MCYVGGPRCPSDTSAARAMRRRKAKEKQAARASERDEVLDEIEQSRESGGYESVGAVGQFPVVYEVVADKWFGERGAASRERLTRIASRDLGQDLDAKEDAVVVFYHTAVIHMERENGRSASEQFSQMPVAERLEFATDADFFDSYVDEYGSGELQESANKYLRFDSIVDELSADPYNSDWELIDPLVSQSLDRALFMDHEWAEDVHDAMDSDLSTIEKIERLWDKPMDREIGQKTFGDVMSGAITYKYSGLFEADNKDAIIQAYANDL